MSSQSYQLHNEGLNTDVAKFAPDILDKMKKFRFRKEKNNAAIIFKLDMETMDVQIEDEIEDIDDVEELQNELPHLQPRFIMYSCKYERSDGRVQYPLVLLFVSPGGGAPKQMMAYSGSRNQFRDLSKISKVFDLRDLEDLTQEWLDEKLKNF
ncbi:unnamed protein product [Oikopleura dioica]|uniref:ADF-H domain-containing protein n=1 Tax=Oikopleura dioica TaxID=34765 RepID=E4XZ05_OIKDI|nr:unnamed protein product [Oikopleura dioica]